MDRSDLRRFAEETEEEYIWRMGEAIESGQIESWNDIVDIVNTELSDDIETKSNKASTYQKKICIAKNFWNNVFSKKIACDVEDELDQKMINLKKERMKLNAQRNEVNRDIRKEARFEKMYSDIKDAITRLPVPKFETRPVKDKKSLEYVQTLADIHCGANFISENNEYSIDICKQRFEKLLTDTIQFVQDNKISKLKILEMGDSIQGILRMSDLKANEAPVVEAVVTVAQFISEYLNNLSKYVDIEYYHCPTSNHSQTRPLISKASELASEDLEYVIANYVKDTLKDNKKVKVYTNFGHEYIEMTIAGHNVIAFHGHQIRGLKNCVKDIQQMKQKFYTTVFLAHYHHESNEVVGESEDSNVEVLIVPAFVGSDPYADSLMRGAKPSCNLYGFDKKYGHIETRRQMLN